MTRCLYVVVCGAGPAGDVDRLVREAQGRNWGVQLISTPAGLDFIDVEALLDLTGNEVRSEYRKPGEPRSTPADAVIVAPTTFRTEGVEVLLGPGEWEPHVPHTGGEHFGTYPWMLALDRALASFAD